MTYERVLNDFTADKEEWVEGLGGVTRAERHQVTSFKLPLWGVQVKAVLGKYGE